MGPMLPAPPSGPPSLARADDHNNTTSRGPPLSPLSPLSNARSRAEYVTTPARARTCHGLALAGRPTASRPPRYYTPLPLGGRRTAPRAHQPGRQPPLRRYSVAPRRPRRARSSQTKASLVASFACFPAARVYLASPSSAARAAISPTRESVSPVEARIFGVASARGSIPGLVRQRRREELEGGTWGVPVVPRKISEEWNALFKFRRTRSCHGCSIRKLVI